MENMMKELKLEEMNHVFGGLDLTGLFPGMSDLITRDGTDSSDEVQRVLPKPIP